MIELQTLNGKERINRLPPKCPFCHKSIIPNLVTARLSFRTLEVILCCSNQECDKIFIGYYSYVYTNSSYEFTNKTSVGNLESKIFSDSINSISQNFVTIYNQAYSAEQMGLSEICGVGYRKSIEFLIKDYIISKKPTEKINVEKKLLANCISEFIDDERIKTVAKRAVWLGNDETHYVRKWETKDLADLKVLIDLTVHWIEMETLTEIALLDMPEK